MHHVLDSQGLGSQTQSLVARVEEALMRGEGQCVIMCNVRQIWAHKISFFSQLRT